MSSDTLDRTAEWFEKAIPSPNHATLKVQLGCHFEEVAEMLETLKGGDRLSQSMLTNAMVAVHGLALHLKNEKVLVQINDELGFLDAVCDQIVTATGCAHMRNLPVVRAMREVNRSNWSKFENGQPVFNANGKIAKGAEYSEPDLKQFVPF